MDFVRDAIKKATQEESAATRPFVILTYAQSLDGCIGSTDNTKPLLLSCPESLFVTHCIRASCDGVLVGAGTVRNDNPRLTVRGLEHSHGITTSPRPVVLDTTLTAVTPSSNIVTLHNKPIVLCSYAPSNPAYSAIEVRRAALEAEGVAVANVFNGTALPHEGISLFTALETLKSQFGIETLMVEGGSRVIGAFLALGRDVVDLLIVTVAPVFVGEGGVKAFTGTDNDGDMVRIVDPVYRQFGRDMVLAGSL
ncbi:dihydrofolate reductase-like domain-containing protein [Chytriomyces sp. MP71]|nr:dihydrofolate reductase-like domain-containing protein [Chytriomyces sp. MP71]